MNYLEFLEYSFFVMVEDRVSMPQLRHLMHAQLALRIFIALRLWEKLKLNFALDRPPIFTATMQ